MTNLHPGSEPSAATDPYGDLVDVSAASFISPPAPQWAGTALRLAVLVVVSGSAAVNLPGRHLPVVVGSAACLLVATACTVLMMVTRPRPVIALGAFLAIGLAGTALSVLLAGGSGVVLFYFALISLASQLRTGLAVVGGAVMLTALAASMLASRSATFPALIGQLVAAAFFFAVGALIRSSRLATDRLRVSQEAQAQAAALAERARLAREIHDVLAHTLTGLVLALDTMELLGRQDIGPDVVGRMLEQVARGQRIARDGLAETRRAIAALRGDEFPGPGLLDRLVRQTAELTGIDAEFSVAGKPHEVSPEIGLTLYRMAQEALTNAAKYAGPGARVRLGLSYEGEMVELSAEDFRADGQPPELRVPGTSGGYGLTGMRERAELLGGTMTAGPTPSGFSVRLRLPLAPAPDDLDPARVRQASGDRP